MQAFLSQAIPSTEKMVIIGTHPLKALNNQCYGELVVHPYCPALPLTR